MSFVLVVVVATRCLTSACEEKPPLPDPLISDQSNGGEDFDDCSHGLLLLLSLLCGAASSWLELLQMCWTMKRVFVITLFWKESTKIKQSRGVFISFMKHNSYFYEFTNWEDLHKYRFGFFFF